MNFLIEHYQRENVQLRKEIEYLRKISIPGYLGMPGASEALDVSEPFQVGGIVQVLNSASLARTEIELRWRTGGGPELATYGIAFSPEGIVGRGDATAYMENLLRRALREIAEAHSRKSRHAK